MMAQVFLFESENLSKEERLRFVLDGQGVLWFDVSEKAPSAHVFYIPSTKEALNQMLSLEKWENMPITVANGFEKMVQDALKKAFLQNLSLAKKSGLLVVGLAKVQEYIEKKPLKALILADDAGKDVSKRVHSMQIMLCHGVTSFDIENALGLNNVSLVCIQSKKEAETLLKMHSKLIALMNE